MKTFSQFVKEMKYGPGDRESTNVVRAEPYEKQDPIGAKIRELETTSEHPKTTQPIAKPAAPVGQWKTTVKPAK